MAKAVCSFCAWPEGQAECPNPGKDCANCHLEIELDSITKERIDAVSEAWNALIFKSGKDEIEHRRRGDSFYKNPIVSALNNDGDLTSLSDALQKLFELRW